MFRGERLKGFGSITNYRRMMSRSWNLGLVRLRLARKLQPLVWTYQFFVTQNGWLMQNQGFGRHSDKYWSTPNTKDQIPHCSMRDRACTYFLTRHVYCCAYIEQPFPFKNITSRSPTYYNTIIFWPKVLTVRPQSVSSMVTVVWSHAFKPFTTRCKQSFGVYID